MNQIVNSTGAPDPLRTYTHDDDGGMTQGYTPEGYAFDATYDAEGRLTSVEYTDSGSILHRTEYIYGGDSLLYEIRKIDGGAETIRRIIRAGFLPIQERDGNNVVVREYVWGPSMGGGIGGLLAIKNREAGADDDYYYLYDGKGNVTALTDSSGSVVATYSYDPFGVLTEGASTFDQPFRFSTKRYDEQTGLSYYGYRFYSASLGKWMTRDPLGEAGGINLYGFVWNDPLNNVDPHGEIGIDTLLVVLGGAALAYGSYKVYDWLMETDARREEVHEIQDNTRDAPIADPKGVYYYNNFGYHKLFNRTLYAHRQLTVAAVELHTSQITKMPSKVAKTKCPEVEDEAIKIIRNILKK